MFYDLYSKGEMSHCKKKKTHNIDKYRFFPGAVKFLRIDNVELILLISSDR